MADKVPGKLWPYDTPAPKLTDVLGQVAHFLRDLGYGKTVTALEKDASKNGFGKPTEVETSIPLMSLYRTGSAGSGSDGGSSDQEDSDSDSDSNDSNDDEAGEDEVEGALVDVVAEKTSDEGSEDKSDADGGNDSESSDSDNDQTAPTVPNPALKRKRVLTPPSSSSDDSSSDSDESMGDDSDSDDSTSSSDDSHARPAKRTKTNVASASSSSVSSDSDSSSSSSSSNGDSDSSSSDPHSDSDSDSDSSAASAESSNSDSSSDSDGDSDSASERKTAPLTKPKTKSAKKAYVPKPAPKPLAVEAMEGSLSSATLEGDSNGEKENGVSTSGMHPDRLKRMPAGMQAKVVETVPDDGRKQKLPFSRIPSNQYVDPKFSSNEYVSYDYADRAYQDLVVTKGKGFTKEKNKKKRGAYRGGAIDLTPKGIKFED